MADVAKFMDGELLTVVLFVTGVYVHRLGETDVFDVHAQLRIHIHHHVGLLTFVPDEREVLVVVVRVLLVRGEAVVTVDVAVASVGVERLTLMMKDPGPGTGLVGAEDREEDCGD